MLTPKAKRTAKEIANNLFIVFAVPLPLALSITLTFRLLDIERFILNYVSLTDCFAPR